MNLDGIPSAELAVLAAVIGTGGDALDDLALRPDDFEDPWHEELYSHMLQLRANGEHIDQITLAAQFPSKEVDIWALTYHIPFGGAHQYHADIVASHGLARRLRAAAAGLMGVNGSMPRASMLEYARRLVDDAAGFEVAKIRYAGDVLNELEAQLKGGTNAVPTPWPGVNKLIGGLRPGALYVIGARPGIGKSVVATQLATEMSRYGSVAFSSLEMSDTEIVGRIVSERLSIYVGKIKNADLTLRDWDALAMRRHEVADLRIAIDDRSSVTPIEIRQFARAVDRQGKLVCLVVDYLQLMTSSSKQDRHVVVSEFTRQMKIMAKELKVPVILLSQLNRMSEQRLDTKPKLSELRESGSIEQDADVVILLSRDPETDTIIFDVAKNRHGQTGEVELQWEGHLSRVTDPTAERDSRQSQQGHYRPMEGTETS